MPKVIQLSDLIGKQLQNFSRISQNKFTVLGVQDVVKLSTILQTWVNTKENVIGQNKVYFKMLKKVNAFYKSLTVASKGQSLAFNLSTRLVFSKAYPGVRTPPLPGMRSASCRTTRAAWTKYWQVAPYPIFFPVTVTVTLDLNQKISWDTYISKEVFQPVCWAHLDDWILDRSLFLSILVRLGSWQSLYFQPFPCSVHLYWLDQMRRRMGNFQADNVRLKIWPKFRKSFQQKWWAMRRTWMALACSNQFAWVSACHCDTLKKKYVSNLKELWNASIHLDRCVLVIIERSDPKKGKQ